MTSIMQADPHPIELKFNHLLNDAVYTTQRMRKNLQKLYVSKSTVDLIMLATSDKELQRCPRHKWLKFTL